MRLKQWTAARTVTGTATGTAASVSRLNRCGVAFTKRHTGYLVLALACAGCVSVTGNDPTLRTPGELLEDHKIEREAKRQIAADDRLAANHINLVSYDGIVLLTGEVEDEALRTHAERAVGNVENVRRIHNEIQVGGATSLVARANDGWIETKVFSKFAADKTVDAARIKVVAENGVVYLIGMVPRDHADAAAEAARTVFGVRKVVKVFDYL